MEVQAGNPFRCVTVLICYLGINILVTRNRGARCRGFPIYRSEPLAAPPYVLLLSEKENAIAKGVAIRLRHGPSDRSQCGSDCEASGREPCREMRARSEL